MNPITRRLMMATALIACPALIGVAADFAASDGPARQSKFNVYDPTGVTLAQFEQSMPKTGEPEQVTHD